ncbi:Histone deacetylase HDT1 [Zostera marina]|uniref:Histone deacetylase HDT1 n=1 Tax=Zostera marina TaxID=29655 RepID=A0A0K9Q1S9_ZOSMR|nr:Histone deacetylase HDT1 [Zostera marina]
MEFWGVEVKPGQNLVCIPGDDKYIHLSQVSLGHTKKSSKSVPIFVNLGQKKLTIGHLSTESCFQFSIDLVFEKDFVLSHGSSDGSVYFVGYKSEIPEDDEFQPSTESDEEMVQVPAHEKNCCAKPDLCKPMPMKKPAVPISKDEDSDEESDDIGDESMSEDDDSEDGVAKRDDKSDEDDSSEEEETPKLLKRKLHKQPASVTKTPVPAKKTRFATPTAKTGGQEKGGHVDTPHPKKQIFKSPATNASSPSLGNVPCKSCPKSFKTDSALQSHIKAKHGTN